MAELTDREIEILNREIDKQGLTYTQLQKELLDHLCCDIEAKMDEGIEFLKAYEEIRKRLEDNRIQEIQEETLLLINQKYRMMKKFMYILGSIAPSLLIVGAVFKLQHWPGANVLIVLGSFLLGAVYLPVFAMVSIRDTRKREKRVNMPMYVVGVITGFIFITGVLFKIMHWPGAGVALTFSVLITVAVFIPVLVIQALKDKENQVQSFSILIFILAFMAVNIMVFALKVSKNVLGSIVVTTAENMATSQIIESRNTLLLENVQLEQTKLMAEETDELDHNIQMIMVDILMATHENNRAAVSLDNTIDLKKASYFDIHKSTELVIFGNEISKGKGEELQTALEAYRELLMVQAGSELDNAIERMLNTGPQDNDQVPWLDYHFRQTPMISALNTLSNLQLKIRFLEGEVLNELLAKHQPQELNQ
ncbi:MAG: hypothetical protein KAR16_01790 [Bacteroidales bacterium]|nr:hypothetical protein [Bacteroidales bacterium]